MKMTLAEILTALFALSFVAVVVGFWGTIIYVAWHFITKFW